MDPAKPKKSGCMKALGWGCVAYLVLGVVAVGVVAANWDAIERSGWYGTLVEAKDEIGNLFGVQQGLARTWEAGEIKVKTTAKVEGDEAFHMLTVEIVNPGFDVPEDPAEREGVARAIALDAAGLHPEIERYDRITVSFSSKKTVGITWDTGQDLVFPVSELVAPPADGDS